MLTLYYLYRKATDHNFDASVFVLIGALLADLYLISLLLFGVW